MRKIYSVKGFSRSFLKKATPPRLSTPRPAASRAARPAASRAARRVGRLAASLLLPRRWPRCPRGSPFYWRRRGRRAAQTASNQRSEGSAEGLGDQVEELGAVGDQVFVRHVARCLIDVCRHDHGDVDVVDDVNDYSMRPLPTRRPAPTHRDVDTTSTSTPPAAPPAAPRPPSGRGRATRPRRPSVPAVPLLPEPLPPIGRSARQDRAAPIVAQQEPHPAFRSAWQGGDCAAPPHFAQRCCLSPTLCFAAPPLLRG